jgi:tRNA(Ile)-lysidine synthase
MYPRHAHIIRPLLDCGRDELREYLRARGQAFCSDETNDDVAIVRNRVRNELLPILTERFNPAVVEALARSAAIAREEHELLDALATGWLNQRAAKEPPRVWRLPLDALSNAPQALARRVVWRVMTELSGRQAGFDDVEQALAVVAGRLTKFNGPRQVVERLGAEIVLRGRPEGAKGRPESNSASDANLFRYSLSIPGEVAVADAGCVISAAVSAASAVPATDRHQVAVQFDREPPALFVRARKPGDRFRPAGAPGRRKLQDFFVDRKVPQAARRFVPLVVDSEDRIVWVAGHAADEAFRVKDPAQAVVVLRLMAGGGTV